MLLRRAGRETSELDNLLADLKYEENAELGKAQGRLQSRMRYKGLSAHAGLDCRPYSNLYIDESGKSHPEPRFVPSYFAMGAVALSDDAVTAYRAAADEIKREFFGRTDITFHEPDMRKHDGPYYFGGDLSRQSDFDAAVDRLVAETDFIVFGVGIRKTAFENDFAGTGVDPYLPTDAYDLAIMLLMERYIDYLATRPTKTMGRVTFESIGSKEDAEHQWGYARVLLDGTQWLPDGVFREWLEPGVRFTPKHGSDPTELADMLSRDLYEWIAAECDATVKPGRWETFCGKVYCREDGLRGKFGLKVFPDTDIRDRVETHRANCGATLMQSAPPGTDGAPQD